MSLLLSCDACQTPIARLDTQRFPVAPAGSFCRACASTALITATLASA